MKKKHIIVSAIQCIDWYKKKYEAFQFRKQTALSITKQFTENNMRDMDQHTGTIDWKHTNVAPAFKKEDIKSSKLSTYFINLHLLQVNGTHSYNTFNEPP